MEELDLVVIGAGWSGLAAAKTFREINPEKSLAIFDSAQSLGGVWAIERLYPGLKTNNMLGTYEYPDFPMSTDVFGVQPGEHIPGHVCHEYLFKYAEKYGIDDEIRYSTQVTVAEHQGTDAWVLTVRRLDPFQDPAMATETKVIAKKLVVATGLTSEPFRPKIKGEESFGGTISHARDFHKHEDTLDTATRVTVFGGTKSGWDAVYASATKGVKVDWVIRSSGHGPSWMAPPYVTPLKRWLEKLVMTRMLTWFSPCVWGYADGYTRIRYFLHRTTIGRAITNIFWSILGNDIQIINQYDSHPETAKLKPWSHPMFVASSFSILNYETDFFELVRNGIVKVHIADITHLSPNKIHLSDGTEIESDVLCCVTGWKWTPPIKFLPEGIDKELGVPHAPSPIGDGDYRLLVDRADKEILETFPLLKNPPVQNKNYVPLVEQKGVSTMIDYTALTKPTPWSLYRFMVPVSPELLQHRDIAFAGFMMNFNVALNCHMQALWINAYFRDEGLSFPPWKKPEELDKFKYDTVLHNRFGKWRYPAGHGNQFPDFVFDALPYIDLLVGDLGLQVHRKTGRLAEILEPYGPQDYKDVVSEWQDRVKKPR